MKPSAAVPASIALVLAAVGVVALLNWGANNGSTTSAVSTSGPGGEARASVTSGYPGHYSVVSLDGQEIETGAPTTVAAADGSVTVRIGEATQRFTEPGAHPLVSPDGKGLGTLVLHEPGASYGERHRTVALLAPEAPLAGCSTKDSLICGFDERIGLVYTVKDATDCRVTLLDTGGRQVMASGQRAEATGPAHGPCIEVLLGGHAQRHEGYGSYPVVSRDGDVLATLVVERHPSDEA